ncbi:Protein masquerade [Frankliniella fusca]|uniref:Protein masquerade n=1 Tax=Frankliniella fusca TaxID=407009 RepID=A0AAE1L8T9_9NEOP|nr:Protein masquerade [Frankliniella fusca]
MGGHPGPRRAVLTGTWCTAGGLLLAALALELLSPPPSAALPIVDPGLFVILGVRTCGGGGGYCLLGSDCTLDRDFAADDAGGHCEGLRAAFTPAAHFSCCKYVERSNATLPGEPADTTATEDPGAATTTVAAADDAENVIETEVLVKQPAASDPPAPASDPPALPAVPAGPASGQTIVAVSEVYKVKGAPDEPEEDEVAEVVAAPAPTKEAVLETPACLTPGGDVNPCWRSSFQDASGATLCSGTLLGVDAAVTTAVCAARIMEAGPTVVLRVDGLSLPVRDIVVHRDYRAAPADPNDIAMIRLFLAGAAGGAAPGGGPGPASAVGAPSPSCIACLPPPAAPNTATGLDGRTCYALAARLNGLGVETSAVCSGRVAASTAGQGLGPNVKLHGCEVATVKAAQEAGEQPEQAQAQAAQAVRAREGAAMLCGGALAGLASTTTGAYSDLRRHTAWITRTLASTRGSAFLV